MGHLRSDGARIPLIVVDAFTSEPFAGNPAAVCCLDAWPDDGWLRQVAAEMNLAETAFVVPTATADDYELRWFTPQVEVDLCGHATLATAHVLDIDGAVRFHTRSGVLTARRDGHRIGLDFPASIGRPVPLDPRLVEALGARVRATSRGSFLLAEVADATVVRTLQPDVGVLAACDPHGVIVTAPGDDGHDIVSRVFVPNVGIPEDAVTGSAHCQLATYWSERLGRSDLSAYQASARGGQLWLRVDGERVILSGEAVTVLVGTISPPPR